MIPQDKIQHIKFIIDDLIKIIGPYVPFPIPASYVKSLLWDNREEVYKWLKRNQQKINQL